MDLEREKARKFREGKEEGFREGKAEGLLEGAIKNAKTFLAMKVLSVEQIAQGTGLPLEKVLELQKQLTKDE